MIFVWTTIAITLATLVYLANLSHKFLCRGCIRLRSRISFAALVCCIQVIFTALSIAFGMSDSNSPISLAVFALTWLYSGYGITIMYSFSLCTPCDPCNCVDAEEDPCGDRIQQLQDQHKKDAELIATNARRVASLMTECRSTPPQESD